MEVLRRAPWAAERPLGGEDPAVAGRPDRGGVALRVRRDVRMTAEGIERLRPHPLRRGERRGGKGRDQQRDREGGQEEFPPENHRPRLCRGPRRNATRRPHRDFGAPAGLPTLDRSMARTFHLIVALLLVSALAPSAAHAGGPRATRAALASQMRHAGSGSGALAVDLDSGSTIYSRRPDTPRTPASVEKLYTTSTALTLYGPDGHLTTRLLGDVGIDPAGVLIGNLYIHGGGDPNFGAAQATELADRLVFELGLREITGRVIGDESAFDSLRGPPSEGYRTTSNVGPLSALTFNRGRTGARRPYWQPSPPLFAARAFKRELERRHVAMAGAARA